MDSFEPETEAVPTATQGLDRLETPALIETLVRDQRRALDAVLEQSEAIAAAVERIVDRLRAGGRLHYAGAGSSGRLGVLDASEMPPTFGVPADLVCAHIAGGRAALTAPVEGAEDDALAAEREFDGHFDEGDALVALSASGSAIYVLRALSIARACGAYAVAVVNSAGAPALDVCDRAIVLRTGPEALAGSTRLKAGTSQKVVMNAISTAVMTRLGKVHDNLMVDVVASNAKLQKRALRLIVRLAGVDEASAAHLLRDAQGSVKIAVVMSRRRVDERQARSLLASAAWSLRAVLDIT